MKNGNTSLIPRRIRKPGITGLKAGVVLLALLALFLGGFAPVQARPGLPDGIDFQALDAAVQAQMAKHDLPGVALGVIQGQEIMYLKAYGVTGNGVPLTPQTQMLIGSQSKSFTALAVAQLAEQGKLDLDAPVRQTIPWFRVADEAGTEKITANHLLHHTSGLSEAGFGVILPPDASLEQVVRSLAQARLTADVGTKHQYFNLGYDVLAYLVEQASGQSYATYIKSHILAPLGMQASTAEPLSAGGLSLGYTRLFGFAFPMPQTIPVYEVGAGYIVSTAEDMARYALAMKNRAGGLVSPPMAQRLFLAGLGSYGMGWYSVNGGTKVFHGGANETFRTEVNLYPSRDLAFVLMTNQGHQIDHYVSAAQLTGAVEAVVLGRPVPGVSQGWSVRWIGWAAGLLCVALMALHARNFWALRGWSRRARSLSPWRRALDISVNFLVPVLILIVLFSQIRAFYDYRFHLATTLAYFPQGLPDLFFLVLVGTVPDVLQGIIKLVLLAQKDWLAGPQGAGVRVSSF